MNREIIKKAVQMSLEEDVGERDVTIQLISACKFVKTVVVAQGDAVVCGIPWFEMVYHQIDPEVEIGWDLHEGDCISNGQLLAELKGKARSILTGERMALNWLQTLSGTATLVRRYIEELKTTKVQLLDTRKTIPCMRYAQKYAVRFGGGKNHRMGLYDAFLIKENHIMSCVSITEAIQKARSCCPEKLVEIEVENLKELQEALEAKADVIMLDNFDIDSIKEAVSISSGMVKLEVSGNVNLQNIQEIAKTGIDFISVGAITKNLSAIDFSMRIS
ncbi:carboxylating nicotinate-nucleotide diphosphorylase [Coxiella endosymbiont of Amblyomma sculptum]|uniref:carboxylating nicotinate-nucleotide diphosphorylase n=1 Tax=Coxiella endosymbiont of Amblyomma sculptum TaxID=2487929 RepID=UPI00132F28C6|nr:carboxylating nicotinate-nucleotide diphosphorylase [Coxiella endosymbiont of Amblyomma sculptum]QHG92406.1 carboxylating nicotinate-nucleotide diphosphorylase [Coxiella endosymbiont of Amblyomma sculptum]